MSETAPSIEKQEPERLRLRGRARPVTRLNKRALMAAAGLTALLIGASFTVALRPPRAGGEGRSAELYNVDTKPRAEALEALPKSYDEVKSERDDERQKALQFALLEQMRAPEAQGPEFGPTTMTAPEPPRRSAGEGARNAGRAARRTEVESEEETARRADVFFRLQNRGRGSNARESDAAREASIRDDAFANGGVLDDRGGFSHAAGSARLFPDGGAERDIGAQFLRVSAQPRLSSNDNPYVIEDQATPFELMAGSVIPASLLTGVNSDLPGIAIAQVTENVYDTATGRYLLIPQGARLIGRYDSGVAFGQSRALLLWTRIIFPDGASINIDDMPASDAGGYAGLSDKVDFHTWRLLKGIALSTLLGVGTELSFDDSDSDLVEALRESAQRSAARAGEDLTRRNLDIAPTIRIRAGFPLRVIVHKDLVLRSYQG